MVSNKLYTFTIFGCVMLLSACSSGRQSGGGFMQQRQFVSQASAQADKPLTTSQKVELMEKAQNYPGLVTYYKHQLEQDDSQSVRLSLAKTYYESGDINSALFQLSYLKAHTQPNAKINYLMAQCFYYQKDYTKALREVNIAIVLDPKDAKNYNLQGVISASLDDFISARRAFEKARSLFYSDAIVLNNLAMVDIYQNQYQRAIDLLMPMYKNGQADKKIRANLLIALAKVHQLGLFEEVYGNADLDKAKRVYNQLNMKTVKGTKPWN
ncbi:tetratricopeptide repeat protein [Celerinatantimonas yamalensis]|uniref:Type IV pilus assembly protein PilF n=1 Tax=Celerinatantimonas yamalensis TaxID=559956 RepID=A0ABW9G3M7_9GAMM